MAMLARNGLGRCRFIFLVMLTINCLGRCRYIFLAMLARKGWGGAGIYSDHVG